jgi:hypothetical protein
MMPHFRTTGAPPQFRSVYFHDTFGIVTVIRDETPCDYVVVTDGGQTEDTYNPTTANQVQLHPNDHLALYTSAEKLFSELSKRKTLQELLDESMTNALEVGTVSWLSIMDKKLIRYKDAKEKKIIVNDVMLTPDKQELTFRIITKPKDPFFKKPEWFRLPFWLTGRQQPLPA